MKVKYLFEHDGIRFHLDKHKRVLFAVPEKYFRFYDSNGEPIIVGKHQDPNIRNQYLISYNKWNSGEDEEPWITFYVLKTTYDSYQEILNVCEDFMECSFL